MKTVDELFENAINHWRDNKGTGTAIIPSPLDDRALILGILQRVYTRSPTALVTIVTKTFNERINLIEYLTQQEDEENNEEFKKLINDKTLKLITSNYVKSSGYYGVRPFVCILYHIDEMCYNVSQFLSFAKFKLVVLNTVLTSNKDMNEIYSQCPLLDDFKQNEIDAVRTNTPVEDMWVGVSIDDTETKKLFDYYTEYINTSISIFGSFEVLDQARIGNLKLNISAMQICNNIAKENGWNEHLDMSVDYNVQIDKLYNPNSIRDRALQTYEIIRDRMKLLANYDGKLSEILNIVNEHKGERILIINKYGEFASKVTEYINDNSDAIICANYHDKVDSIPAVDINGNPIYIKSGEKKGERRYMAAQAQKTLNEALFNTKKINILSTNSAPDKSLAINVDIIIITSPLCEDIKSYIYRLSNVRYPNNKIKLYSLYVNSTLEESRLKNKPVSETHKILNGQKNNIINENNFDFIVVD